MSAVCLCASVTNTADVVSNGNATYSYKLHFATGEAVRRITVLAPNLARVGCMHSP